MMADGATIPAWREAENLIETKKPRDYDLAVAPVSAGPPRWRP
jgi:hypothetical protein